MPVAKRISKSIACVVMAAHMLSLGLPSLISAQAPPCRYDKANPSMENARYHFRITDYDCAEQELLDFLSSSSLDLNTRADGHVLLAAVYYAKLRDADEKRDQVLKQFVAAFEALLDWQGALDIKAPGFRKLMDEARGLVGGDTAPPTETETVRESAEPEPEQPKIVDAPPVDKQPKISDDREPEEGFTKISRIQTTPKSKPWYKKWWVLGLGVGVVATSVVIATGGGGDDDDLADLPGFPSTPGR